MLVAAELKLKRPLLPVPALMMTAPVVVRLPAATVVVTATRTVVMAARAAAVAEPVWNSELMVAPAASNQLVSAVVVAMLTWKSMAAPAAAR